jgi:SOS response regulatory protein OraA/RecX
VPIDAERWLASRGVRREPLIGDGAVPEQGSARPEAPPPGVREIVDLARQVAAEPDETRGVPSRTPQVDGETLATREVEEVEDTEADDESRTSRDGHEGVATALAFIHRSTANAPQAEGRLRSKLSERGYPGPVVDEALAQARQQRLVDDDAMLAALIAERRARGHADRRLRRDLRDRGFTGLQVDEALALHAHTDPAAAAFALARDQAARHRSLEPEAAVRRTIGHLVRRGHSEGLARKAARDAVYADREAQEIAGR